MVNLSSEMSAFYRRSGALLMMLLLPLLGWGQTTIFNVAGGGAFPTGWVGANTNTTNPIDQGSYYLVETNPVDVITTDSYNLSAYTSATFTVNVATFGNGTNNPAKIEVSLDGGTNYTQTNNSATATSSTYVTTTSIPLTGVSGQVRLRISNGGTTGKGVRLQSLKLVASGSSIVAPVVTTTTPATSITAASATLGGNITTLGSPAPSANGVVYSVTSANATPTAGGTSSTTVATASPASGTGTYTVSATGLTSNTAYSYQAYVTNNSGTAGASNTVYGGVQTFTTKPTVSTAAVTTFDQTTATAGGSVAVGGGASVSDRGVYYSTTSGFSNGSGTKVQASTATGTGAFTSAITGLNANTTYYVVAYATNAGGTSYGPEASFTTPAPVGTPPTVTTTSATATGQTTATADGNVSSEGTASVTDRGVYYSTTNSFNPATTGTKAQASPAGGAGTFTVSLTGLTASTTYYVVAYASSTVGTSYGSQVSFTTPAPPPALTPTPASRSGFTYAVGSGPSAAQTFGLNGTNLTGTPGTITVSASASYEVSLDGTTYSSTSVAVPYATATLNSATAFYARLKAGLAIATYNETLTIAGGGATTSVGVNGSVTAALAVVNATPSSLALGTANVNVPGAVVTYQVSGSNLGTTPILITPPAGVEISKDGFATAGNTSTTSLTVSPSGGIVAPTTISVRIAASSTTGPVSGNITNVSGAGSASVAVTGAVSTPGSACLSEGFENATFPPSGWLATGVARSTTAGDFNSGAAAAVFSSNNGTLTTPVLVNPSQLKFYLGVSGNASAKQFLVKVSTTSQTTGFTTIQTYSHNTTGGTVLANNTYNQYTVDLSAYAASSTVWVQFEKVSSTTSPFRFDDVAVICGGTGIPLSLSTGTISGAPFCVGEGSAGSVAVSVPYTVTGGSFSTGNVFTAYLSNDNFATKFALGTLASVTNGTISGTISQTAGLTTASNYRIRVEASTPATNGTDNGTDLAVSSYLDNKVTDAGTYATPGNGTATLTFTAPANCVTGVIVTIRAGAAGGSKPLPATTYTASTSYTSPGTELGSGSGQYVVYNAPVSSNGTGTVTVTGLTNGTLYNFQVFTTNGNGYSNSLSRSVRPVVPATVTDVIVPQFISARTTTSTHTTRLPYVWRSTISGLQPSTTYLYYTAARASTDAADNGGGGIPIEIKTSGAFVRGSGPVLTASSSSFTTDASGSYTGWFGLEPTNDARFASAALLFPMVVINAGDGTTTATQYLPTTASVKALLLSTTSGTARGVRGNSFGTPGNLVMTYDNTSGTGRPLAGTYIESDGTPSANYVGFYGTSVEGVTGAYGLLTPSTGNANGIRAVEQRSLATGLVVGCTATDADGTWPGTSANTVNPTAGPTALVLTSGDTPFQPATITAIPAHATEGSTITITGTGFTTGPVPTISFNGGAAVPASSIVVNSTGTSLTVVVPAGTSSGPVSLTAGCGTTVTSATTLTIDPSVFYTVTSATDLSLLSSFTINADGTPGTQPTDFSAAGLTFNIMGAKRTFESNWVVSGTGSKVVLTAGSELIIPVGATLTARLDQAANSTLTIVNSTAAAISNITQTSVQAATSTINLAQNGTYVVPPSLTFTNLRLTNGIKQLDANYYYDVPGNLVFDNTTLSSTLLNTSATGNYDYSIFRLYGNLTHVGTVGYDALRSIDIQLMNTSTTQVFDGNGSTITLHRLTGNSSAPVGLTLTTPGTVLELGNQINGGLDLASSSTLVVLNANTTLRFIGGGNIFGSNAGLLKPDPGANIEFIRTTANTFPLGFLEFATGFSTINNFVLNATASTAADNVLTMFSNLTVNGTATLQAGTLELFGSKLTLNGPLVTGTAIVTGSPSSDLAVTGTGALGSLKFGPNTNGRTLRNLTMNRVNGNLPLGSVLSLSGALTLTNGLVTTTAANLLTLTNAASVNGGTATSFINGPLARVANSGARTVLFPIGKGTAYRPLTLTTTTQTINTTYTAEQFETPPAQDLDPGNGLGSAPLKRVSYRRYFNLTPSPVPTAGQFAGKVTLSFGTDDYVNNPEYPTLVVAKRDAASANKWVNIDRSASTGTGTTGGGAAVAGTLTSATFTNFSDFALGATNTNTFIYSQVNPLPVELVAFNATREKMGVQVKWATASEKNNDHFEVQRSPDGQTFRTIATVAGKGSGTQATYATLDRSAPASQLYYRLRQVDADGSTTFSPVLMVGPGALALVIFPNPAHSDIHFQTPTDSPMPYRMLNQLGQVVRIGQAPAGVATLDVAGLPTGLYMLELQTATGRVVSKFHKE
jgi:hypothetical protein